MFFRFGSAVALVVLIALAGVGLEKQNLEMRRQVSRQQFRLDVLVNQHAQMRLKTQQLGAPIRMIEELEKGRLQVQKPQKQTKTTTEPRKMPLLRWQKGIESGRE
jgi:hypothetical protein